MRRCCRNRKRWPTCWPASQPAEHPG
jgi:hypothetical protein